MDMFVKTLTSREDPLLSPFVIADNLILLSRVGRGNLSIFSPSTARENFKLVINGRLTIPIAHMALPLATPVAFLNELGNPEIV